MPALHSPPEEEGVWAEHVPAAEAFLASATQWRTQTRGGGPYSSARMVFLGLDYSGVDVSLRRVGLELSPKSWSDLQIIELAAAAALNED
ncbi:DUF1799 domain-containing protein [Thalassovita sp.]|uniref:DUF1799 domain-containing protein n=1 Tax=Thalassovita sp. TaxID=1979401 RepID=UPI002B27A4BA|nr:DUF1799 domain-containing protein [Thalassovita sp.]